MLTVDQALALVAQQVAPLPATIVALRDALDCVLAEGIASDIDSPPHDKAMMDGYAVVASDSSLERSIVEEVMAGDVPTRAIQLGQATRIMTGAPVPDGATAVVPVEKTQPIDANTVLLDCAEQPQGKHIMPRGTSLRVGQHVLTVGTRMREIEVAIAAEVGAHQVSVTTRPRVAVLATGNELVDVAEQPAAGFIRNTNGPMLAAATSAAGAQAIELPVSRDDLGELRARVEDGLAAADVLLISGGVSAGKKDLAPQVLEASGVEQVFHKLALKPGKPLYFGIVGQTTGPPKLVFGLPGNPASGLVCFHLFVKPALAVLSGYRSRLELPLTTAEMAVAFDHRGGRETFRPARFSATKPVPKVDTIDWKGSADLASLSAANCLLRLPAEPVELAQGDGVEILCFDA